MQADKSIESIGRKKFSYKFHIKRQAHDGGDDTRIKKHLQSTFHIKWRHKSQF